MIRVSLRTRDTKKGKSYHVGYYDPSRTPARFWRALRTSSPRVARQYVAQIEQKIALEGFDPWTDGDPFPEQGRTRRPDRHRSRSR